MQLNLPHLPAQNRPRRRTLWREDLRRLAAVHADERCRDRQEHEAALSRLAAELADVRARLLDIERHAGIADLHVAPTRRQLRAWAGR